MEKAADQDRYYDYTKGYEAVIPGIQQFGGKVVHPQFWPQDLDYANKKVAIIGSGATTITLVPAMAKLAKKVTMVQRSPSYIISMPNRNRKKAWWQYITPEILQRRIFRWTSLLMLFFLRRLIKNPNIMKRFLENNTKAALPPNVDFDPHFKPTYAPGTQRICLCPDADFFESLRDGKAEIATGVIRTVTPDGILLESGQKIDADIIVTATVKSCFSSQVCSANFKGFTSCLRRRRQLLYRRRRIDVWEQVLLARSYDPRRAQCRSRPGLYHCLLDTWCRRNCASGHAHAAAHAGAQNFIGCTSHSLGPNGGSSINARYHGLDLGVCGTS